MTLHTDVLSVYSPCFFHRHDCCFSVAFCLHSLHFSSSKKKTNKGKVVKTRRDKKLSLNHITNHIFLNLGINKESSLDNLFSPSRPMKHPFDHRAGSDEDSEDYVVTSSKKTNGIVQNKENKCKSQEKCLT